MPRFTQTRSVSPSAARVLTLLAMFALVGCAPSPPVYQGASAPAARTGTVDSIREYVQPREATGLGAVGGALIGGGLGSLIGGGTGRTVATIVGAVGGGYMGHQVEKNQTDYVYEVGIKYDDGTWATIRQSAASGLRIGDRVVVTDSRIQLLR